MLVLELSETNFHNDILDVFLFLPYAALFPVLEENLFRWRLYLGLYLGAIP